MNVIIDRKLRNVDNYVADQMLHYIFNDNSNSPKQRQNNWNQDKENQNQNYHYENGNRNKNENKMDKKKLPKHLTDEILRLHVNSGNIITCPICYQDIENDLQITTCGHKYCKSCFDCIDSCGICKQSLY